MRLYHIHPDVGNRLVRYLLQVTGIPAKKILLLYVGVEYFFLQKTNGIIMLMQLCLQEVDRRVSIVVVSYAFIVGKGGIQIKTGIGGMIIVRVDNLIVVDGGAQYFIFLYRLFFLRIHAPHKKRCYLVAHGVEHKGSDSES